LKKGEDREPYNPFLAQRKTDSYARSRSRALKINDATWQMIKNNLTIRWLPYQTADFLHIGASYATVVPPEREDNLRRKNSINYAQRITDSLSIFINQEI